MNNNFRSNIQLFCWLHQCPFVLFHLFLLLLVHPVELVLDGLLPHLALNQHLVGHHPDQVPGLPVPGPGDPEEVVIHVDHVDKVEGEQPEEESTYPADELEELQGHGVVVLHLHLGKGHVDDGFQGKLAGVGPATTEEGAKDSEDNAEDDGEEVEPGVDMGKRLQPSPILWLLFSGRSSEAIFSEMVLSLLPVASFSFSFDGDILSLCFGGDVHLV